MAAERPENADERLVADALQKAFGGPVPGAAFHAGREAVVAAAALSAEEVAADEELVTAAMQDAFAVPLGAEVRAEHVTAIHAAAAAAQDTNVIPLRRFGQRVGRHAVAAAVAVSTLAGGSGVAAASTDALPGQMLYPVKRAVEQVMLTAAWTPTAEARVQTQLAARRLNEAELLLASGASPELVAPLLSEYDQHVAVVEDLAITSASVEVAVLEEKADALREQATAVATADTGFDDAALTTAPTETSSPAATATEPPTSGATEATTADDQPAAPAPEPSSSSAPRSASDPADTSSGTGGGDGSSGTTTTQPAPTSGTSPTPSPTPTPTATPTPTRPPQSEVDESKKPAPGQQKPKPNKPKPSPTASPTVNPDRAPVSDSEPVYDAGPLAEWEEQSFVDGS